MDKTEVRKNLEKMLSDLIALDAPQSMTPWQDRVQVAQACGTIVLALVALKKL